MRLKPALLLCIFVVVLSAGGRAQSGTRACGECAVVGNRTLEQANECAFQEAAAEALNRAGIERMVVGSSTLSTSQAGESFAQTFVEASNVSWRGGITGVQDVTMENRVDELGDMVVSYCADFQVAAYETTTDPAFQFDVQGLRAVYQDESDLAFQVKGPSAHFQAYLIEGEQALRFYPNASEAGGKLDFSEGLMFPSPESQSRYLIFKEPGLDGPWLIVLIFTKADCTQATPEEWPARELMFWLQSIEPNQRFTHIQPFTITD